MVWLILYEAVLSYVGVGVDPAMNSFGGMINQARSEMSRDPIVWWSFAAAFVFMVAVVLAANLFADAVRDGGFPPLLLDPIDFGALYMQQALANSEGQQAAAAPEGNA